VAVTPPVDVADASALPPRAARTRGALVRRSESAAGWGFVAPALLLFGAFIAFPVGFATWLSLHSWDGFSPIGEARWVGFGNFRNLLDDGVFRTAAWNTTLYAVVSTIVQIGVGFVLAFALWHLRPRLSSAMRALIFFPTILSMVVVGSAWSHMLAYDGPVNSFLGLFGMAPIGWLSDPTIVKYVIIWVASWQWSGWTMVLLLAGMLGIPRDVVEAAAIDGARSFTVARHVAIPLVRPVLGLAVLLNIIGAFQVFDTVYVLTGGGPNHASEMLGTYSYWIAFSGSGTGDLGYAASLSMVMIAALFAFAIVRIRMSRLV
jgi:ABC-type sugar transport system permease subunit